MRKGRFLAIFIAIVLLVVGGVFLGIAIKNNSFAGNYEDLTYTPEGAFTNIKIDSDTANVYFKESEDDNVKVDTHLSEYSKGSVEVVEGTLIVKEKENRIWYKSLFTFGQENKIYIYLPLGVYNELNVNNDTGDISVIAGFTFENVTIKTDTGDIKLRSNVNGLVDINVDTGDVLLDNMSVKNLRVTSDTGDVKLNKVTVVEDIIKIKTSTGDVDYIDVTCVNLTQNSDTGHSKLTRVVASGKIDITTDTGDVRFLSSDASELDITTDTGDVKGTFLTPKIIFATTDTGKIKISQSTVGDVCRVKTDTGDIILSIVE